MEVTQMKYIASVRDRQTRELMLIEHDYPTKKAFRADLAGNGYSIRFIATEETFDTECEKWYAYNESSKLYHKIRRDTDKKIADKYGISVAHYRRANKAYMEAIMDESRICYLTFEDFIELYK